MSVTKPKTEDGKLVSQADAHSVRLSNRSSLCSCPECDSTGCFTKRNKDICQCGECKDPKTCIAVTAGKLAAKKTSQAKKDADPKDTATKKVIREVVTRETIESLKKVTETLYGFDNENLEMITERLSKLSNKKLRPNIKTSEVGNKSVCENKEDTKKTDSKECCKQVPIGKTPSADVNQPQKEADKTATKLSAQVMNVPYEELHESVPSEVYSEHKPLSKLNIFKRIKEIYEACSCKVCECIASKPITVPDEICKCKPCDCHDCASLKRKINQSIRKVPHTGCPCIRCDRKDCKGIVKSASEPQACDCKPCDCIQCTENAPKPCNCEPCQCINCKSLNVRPPKTVKLAPMENIAQREACQCSPCECIECKQIYNRTNPTVMCTTSTEMTRYRHCRCDNCPVERCQFGETENCTCQRHSRTMRKSFEKNYNDYDIRTVIVDTNSPFNQNKQSVIKTQSTVALYASLSNYPYNSRNKSICKCLDCECILCPGRDETTRRKRDTLQSKIRLIQNNVQLNASLANACTCASCECEICIKREGEQYSSSIPIHSNCKCDICDCLNCPSNNTPFPTCSTGIQKTAKPISNVNRNSNCNCDPCECRNCRKLFSCNSQNSMKYNSDRKNVERKTVRCLRKVMLVSPSRSEFNSFRKTHGNSVSSTTLSPKKSIEGIFRQDIANCHSIPRNGYASVSHPLNTEEENRINNNNISNGLKKNVLFNFNEYPIESPSQSNKESDQNRHIVETYNNLHQMTLKSLRLYNDSEDKLYESKYKDSNIINDTPIKISPNDSDESLPVFFTYHNEALYANNVSPNICDNYKSPVSRPIDDKCFTATPQSKYGIASCSHIRHENKVLGERTERRNNQINTIEKTLVDDYLVEGLKGSSYDKTYDNIFNNGRNIPHESHNNNDTYSVTIKDNNKGNEATCVDNYSDLTLTYEKAKKVLREAKAFSQKLVKMLDSFDKANREFRSESQKFKKLHKSLLDISNGEIDKSCNTNLRQISDPYVVPYGNTSHAIQECEETEDNTNNENKAEKEYEQFTRKPREFTNSKYMRRLIFLSNDIFKMKYSDEAIVQNDNIHEGYSKDTQYYIPQESSITPHEEKLIKRSTHILLKKSRTSHRLILKGANLGANYLNLTQDLKDIGNSNGTNEQTQRMALVMRKLDSVFGNTTNNDLNVKTEDKEKKSEDQSEQVERQPWTVFRKNLFLNTVPPGRNQRLFGSPTMETDIKEAIQAIKIQSANQSFPKVVSRANEALTNLQSEVSSLLNMPILQSKEKAQVADAAINSETKGKTESILSTASSQTHDPPLLKVDKEVNFNSDQINQLLVDGRAAQRCGAARRAAVLTCLPPAARLLLSVRAVGPSTSPAHTVLYRPRR
ncbi:uncharacterized protein [Epargyreus clarus]|uniref:uncharacterized protein n=1 Tax=Epargyreus clarus TaxID=520877 RepID=UPI003C2E06DB